MELYDLHTHILPAFDDGAKSVEVSLELIDKLRQQGIHNIVLTPHFYTNEQPLDEYLEKRQAAFDKFKPFIPEDINIVLGCEVYVTRYLFNNDNISGLAYGKSKYILTEYSYNSTFSENTMKCFYLIAQNHGLIPIMPHVERYPYLLDNPSVIEQLQDMGVIIQTNISSYTKEASFFKKRKLLKMIDRGLIDVLGSDTHSMRHNPPDVFKEAMDTIKAKCGTRKLNSMMRTAGEIFNAALGENY